MMQPCPFCGHEANGVSDNGRGLAFNVHCGRCRASGPWERCAADAIPSWNVRVQQAATPDDDAVERKIFDEAVKRGVDQDTADQVAQAVAADLCARAA